MSRVLHVALCAALCTVLGVGATRASRADAGRVPDNTLLVKGAWASASDATTPLPEGGSWATDAYQNDYFGLTLRFSGRWQPGLPGPPPSDSGAYVLAQVVPAERYRAGKPGHLLITAQDTFFTNTRAGSALELVNYTKDHLDGSVYRVEEAPRETTLGQRNFVRFGYRSLIAGMHWTVLATEVRCHVVEFIFVSNAPRKMAELQRSMDELSLGAATAAADGTGHAPLCIKGYATAEHIVEREEPILTEPRYNPIPVRIIIDAEGRVRHMHFLRAFPDQAAAITEALRQWRFKPYLVDGKPMEVETGLVFGRAPHVAARLP
jgi:hypothetical protein